MVDRIITTEHKKTGNSCPNSFTITKHMFIGLECICSLVMDDPVLVLYHCGKQHCRQENILLDMDIDLLCSGADRGCNSATEPFSNKLLTTIQNSNNFLTELRSDMVAKAESLHVRL